jgi:hypothetical protein
MRLFTTALIETSPRGSGFWANVPPTLRSSASNTITLLVNRLQFIVNISFRFSVVFPQTSAPLGSVPQDYRQVNGGSRRITARAKTVPEASADDVLAAGIHARHRLAEGASQGAAAGCPISAAAAHHPPVYAVTARGRHGYAGKQQGSNQRAPDCPFSFHRHASYQESLPATFVMFR